MGKRHFQLTEKEIQEFKRYESQVKRIADLKRLQGVRLYGTGRSLSEILDIVGYSESTLRRWVGNYTEKGIVSLKADYTQSAQNSRKLNAEQAADLREKLHQYSPKQVLPADQYHGTGQFWTVDDVKTVVEMWYAIRYTDLGSYRNLLHRCGFSFQRTERVYKSRPSEMDVLEFEAELEKK